MNNNQININIKTETKQKPAKTTEFGRSTNRESSSDKLIMTVVMVNTAVSVSICQVGDLRGCRLEPNVGAAINVAV
jgi:hypothetical protein